MPKQKTKRSAAKRFKIKKSGKVRRKKANLRHNLTTSKSRKQKRNLRAGGYVHGSDVRGIRLVLPYG